MTAAKTTTKTTTTTTPTPTAVVSGLGPNGMLAALALRAAGFRVVAVEHRPEYARPIHLSLRRSWLDDVRALDADLAATVDTIAAPIEEVQRFRVRGGRVEAHCLRPVDASLDVDLDLDLVNSAVGVGVGAGGVEPTVTRRLQQHPVVHVRLDELERVMFAHLAQVAARTPADLRIVRGARATLEDDPDRDAMSVRLLPSTKAPSTSTTAAAAGAPKWMSGPIVDEAERGHATVRSPTELGTPDVIVVAEGGKSQTAAALGMRTHRFSTEKLFLSVHVDVPLGPITRRVDTEVLVHRRHDPVPVSYWATGHKDQAKGTWIVCEIPAALHRGAGSNAVDVDYFARAADDLVGLGPVPAGAPRGVDAWRAALASRSAGFAGTFRFEQQLLEVPAAASNVVFFGDAAGMGHHALSTGLELGACDLRPLRTLLDDVVRRGPQRAHLRRYADEVVASRIALLAFGLKEYYPELDAVDATPSVHSAYRTARSNPDVDARAIIESLLLLSRPPPGRA